MNAHRRGKIEIEREEISGWAYDFIRDAVFTDIVLVSLYTHFIVH